MAFWSLLVSQPNKERLAAQNIMNQKYILYLPMFKEKILKEKKIIEVAKPLFNRYIFVQIENKWASLTGTYGVSGLVMDGQSPKVVPERVVEEIRTREDKNGFVVLEEENTLKSGKLVKITGGPLKDTIGIFQGMNSDERALVLFKMLGSERTLKVNPKLLVVT